MAACALILRGVYDVVNRHEAIGYTMEDGRRVDIAFVDQGNETKVIETFDAESSNPIPNKTNHREEDAGEDARRLSF